MMDSVELPFTQSTSEVDNRFNGWSSPLFKVALCPPASQTRPTSVFPTDLDLDQSDHSAGFETLDWVAANEKIVSRHPASINTKTRLEFKPHWFPSGKSDLPPFQNLRLLSIRPIFLVLSIYKKKIRWRNKRNYPFPHYLNFTTIIDFHY